MAQDQAGTPTRAAAPQPEANKGAAGSARRSAERGQAPAAKLQPSYIPGKDKAAQDQKWRTSNDADFDVGALGRCRQIQRSDGLGGRNFEYRFGGSAGGPPKVFHVHYNGAEGWKLNTLRLKGSSPRQDRNLLTSKEGANLKNAAGFAFRDGFPNAADLLMKIHDANQTMNSIDGSR